MGKLIMTNIYKKYCSGVFCMESDNSTFNHGDQTTITTKHGKEIAVTVWKRLTFNQAKTYYSVIREDGFNRTEWTRRKMERAQGAAERQERLSDEYYTKSRKDADFLSLGEPIKVGHHSEKRHRKAIDQAWDNMGKSVEASKKAERYEDKAQELEYRLNKEINIDTPEAIDLLIERIEDLTAKREAIKARDHASFELSNIGANIRRYNERLELARKLWDLDYNQPSKAEKRSEDKAAKQKATEELLAKCEVFWAFSTEQFNEKKKDGEVYVSIGGGGYMPKRHVETFKAGIKAA